MNEEKIFESNQAFMEQMLTFAKDQERVIILSNRKKFNAKDVSTGLKKYLAFTVKGNKSNQTLWIYDYDTKKYTNDYTLIVKICNLLMSDLIDNKNLNKIITDLIISNEHIDVEDVKAPWLATNNHIVNTETNEVKEYSIYTFTTSNIKVNYSNTQNCPTIDDKNILDIIMDLANNNYERYLGLLQVIKQSVLKQNLDQSVVFLIGEGGSGKSTYLEIIENFINQDMVSHNTIEDLEKDDKVINLATSHVMLGDDINDGLYIERLKNFKTLSGGNAITVSQKYKDSTSFKFEGCLIQCMPEIIKAKDRSGQIARRMKPYLFKHDFKFDEYKINTNELKKYLANEQVKKYLLYQILNMEELKNKSTFIGWDKETVEEAQTLNNPYYAFNKYLAEETSLLKCNKIPATLLAALYNDFNERNTRSTFNVTTTGFNREFSLYMEKLGYTLSKSNQKIRPLAYKYYLEKDNEYKGLPIIKENVEKLLNDNNPSRYWLKN